MTHVAVLYGGTSREREVSIRSAEAVGKALETAGYTLSKIDPADLTEEQLLHALDGCDVVFPVLHGAGGEDGVAQQWLEEQGFMYVGSDSAGSAVCFDKIAFKTAAAQFGIPIAQGERVDADSFWKSEIIKQPYVLKPITEGSSVDTFIVRNPAAADTKAIKQTLLKYGDMLLEKLVEGTEITIAVVGDAALPVIEIIPPSDGEFDYENKYNGKTQELCPPKNVAENVQKQAQTLALKIHRQLRLRDMSRTDMIVQKSDSSLVVLESNTIPGLTDQSLLPKAAAAAGMDMPKLVSVLVEAALARPA